MIHYLFLVKGKNSSVSEITVVTAKTLTEATDMIMKEFSDPSQYNVRLVEYAENLSFLN